MNNEKLGLGVTGPTIVRRKCTSVVYIEITRYNNIIVTQLYITVPHHRRRPLAVVTFSIGCKDDEIVRRPQRRTGLLDL